MQQDPILKKRYSDFIKTVVKKQKVYSLENTEGIASADALYHSNTEGQPKGMIFFWSEKRLADRLCNAEWDSYAAKEIKLADFLEKICIGLYQDQHIVGINFDTDLLGYEVAPLQLALDTIIKLRKTDTNLSLSRYEDMKIFEQLVREHLNNES